MSSPLQLELFEDDETLLKSRISSHDFRLVPTSDLVVGRSSYTGRGILAPPRIPKDSLGSQVYCPRTSFLMAAL